MKDAQSMASAMQRSKQLRAEANEWVDSHYDLSRYGYTRDVANAAYYAGYMAAMEQLCCSIRPPEDEPETRENERYE